MFKARKQLGQPNRLAPFPEWKETCCPSAVGVYTASLACMAGRGFGPSGCGAKILQESKHEGHQATGNLCWSQMRILVWVSCLGQLVLACCIRTDRIILGQQRTPQLFGKSDERGGPNRPTFPAKPPLAVLLSRAHVGMRRSVSL